MNVQDILKNVNLKKDEKKIIDTLFVALKDKEKVSIRELASQTYISTSSIVRLARKIGFYGYSDMVYSFKKYQKEIVEFNDADTLNHVVISSDSLKFVDELIMDVISNKYKRFHFEGLGYSSLVCQYIVTRMVEMNYFATEVNPLDMEDDEPFILVFVTKSGETNDFYKIVEGCKDKNCKMYVICSVENSTICKMLSNKIIISQKESLKESNSYFTGNAIILMEKIATAIYNNKK